MGPKEAALPAGGGVRRRRKGDSGAITRGCQWQKGAGEEPWVHGGPLPRAWGAFLPAVPGDTPGGANVLYVWP